MTATKPNAFQWDHLKSRSLDQFTQKIDLEQKLSHPGQPLLLGSPSDLGVCRNGGRRGAQYAPQAVLNNLKKLADRPELDHLNYQTVSDPCAETIDFTQAQVESAKRIQQAITTSKPSALCHLGGGHDHVYPLLMALHALAPEVPIHIINVDAHLDTRIDQEFHSGTPFRQFANQVQTPCYLTQLGIHSYANPSSNYELLNKTKMNYFGVRELRTLTRNFCDSLNESFLKHVLAPINPQWKESWLILSVDCDGLEASVMEGVSAVNHHGLPLSFMSDLIAIYTEMAWVQFPVLGFYEYNPLYDNLSQKGSRTLAALIYDFLGQIKRPNHNP